LERHGRIAVAMPARQPQRATLPTDSTNSPIDESELWSMGDAHRGTAANLESLGFGASLK